MYINSMFVCVCGRHLNIPSRATFHVISSVLIFPLLDYSVKCKTHKTRDIQVAYLFSCYVPYSDDDWEHPELFPTSLLLRILTIFLVQELVGI